MENLKIRVNSASESKEAQELFFELGCKWYCSGEAVSYTDKPFLYAIENKLQFGSNVENFHSENSKEIALPQLRDMVVLKRNDVGDAQFIDDSMYKWYVGHDGKRYRFQGDKFIYQPYAVTIELKPIEKQMKEYLKKYPNGNYELMNGAGYSGQDNWIEIPDGATAFTVCGNHKAFWKTRAVMFLGVDDSWDYSYEISMSEYLKITQKSGGTIAWQRLQQPESLPFVDDEKTGIEATLNERESQYGSFEDVAGITQHLLKTLSCGTSFEDLTAAQVESLHMICSKMARIVNGNPDHKDSWHDIAGYAKLIEDLI